MAIAFMPPPERARNQKQADRLQRLQSIDPVTRWNAREEIFSDACIEMGKSLVKQSEETGKAFQKQLEYYDRVNQENSKYKRINPNEIK